MEYRVASSLPRGIRIQRALLLCGAAALFLLGLVLLFAPAPAEDQQSCAPTIHFLCGDNGRIIGSQSRKPISLAGG